MVRKGVRAGEWISSDEELLRNGALAVCKIQILFRHYIRWNEKKYQKKTTNKSLFRKAISNNAYKTYFDPPSIYFYDVFGGGMEKTRTVS